MIDLEYSLAHYGIDLSKPHKTGCPKCKDEGRDRSNDNLTVYGLDENNNHRGAYCFACNFTIPSIEKQLENGEEVTIMGSEFNDDIHANLKCTTSTDPKGYRGIRKDISVPFGVRYKYDDNGSVKETYYPATQVDSATGSSKPVGYKIRSHPKNFATPGSIGVTGVVCEMFGQHRFKTFGHTLLIVGGEHDALAAFQMLSDAQRDKKYDPVAVVSATIGEAGTAKQIQQNFDFFSRFKKIVLCLDSDQAGQKAAEQCISVLPEGKVYIMKMRRKDPNSYIFNNETKTVVGAENEFISDFWAAKLHMPDGVQSASEAFSGVAGMLLAPRIPLPSYMHRMERMMGGSEETGYGILQERICNIIGDTSSGKSTHVNRMVYHWIFNSPIIPTIVTLEHSKEEYVFEMFCLHLKENLRWNMEPSEIVKFMGSPQGKEIENYLCYKENGDPRFYLIDERKGSIKGLEQQMEKMLRKHGSKLFVIDVLTDLLRGSNEAYAEDHLAFQKGFLAEGATIVNVLHTRKPQQTGDGKTRKVTEYDALGTGSFVQSAAYNIVIHRDKMADDNTVKNTTEVELMKCRFGKTGHAGHWYFDFKTLQCYDLKDHPVASF